MAFNRIDITFGKTMKWLEKGKEGFKKESKLIESKSKMDNAKDKPIKIFKSPPPQNPINHRTNEITVIKAVETIEKRNMSGLLNNIQSVILKIKP